MGRMEGSSAAAVARAKRGDQEAFRELVERHSQHVFRLAWRLTRSETDAEDVVQETFWKAWKQLPGFEGRSEFSSWLHRIAANCALDLLRSRGRRPETALPEEEIHAAPEPGPERRLESAEVSRTIAESLDGMTPMERTAFVLRHFEGRSIEEIGQALGVKQEAAKQSVFRAVAKLRRALAPAAGMSS
jgi:RNA polymerase sigma-70 factor (ECF subfamily)